MASTNKAVSAAIAADMAVAFARFIATAFFGTLATPTSLESRFRLVHGGGVAGQGGLLIDGKSLHQVLILTLCPKLVPLLHPRVFDCPGRPCEPRTERRVNCLLETGG